MSVILSIALAQGRHPEVRYVLHGVTVFCGTVEYVSGSWAGIRQADGRLDEAPADLCVIEPASA